MKITNITSQEQYFAGGANTPTSGRGIRLAASASGSLDDHPETLTKALGYASQGLVALAKGPVGSTIAQPVDVPANQVVKFSSVLTATDITVGGVVFELRSSGTAASPKITVALGANDAAAAANLKAAINANAALVAAGYKATDIISVGATDQRLVIVNTAGGSVAVTVNGTTMTAQSYAAQVQGANRFSLVSVAATTTSVAVVTGLTTIDVALVQVVTAAGAIKPFDGVLQIVGGTVVLTGGTSAIIASTDVVTVFAYGF